MCRCNRENPCCDAGMRLRVLRLILVSGMDVPEAFAAMVAVIEPDTFR